MTVYIEYVVIDNLVIDSLLLDLARKSLKLKRSKGRIFLAALFGTAVACVLPLLELSLPLALLLRFSTGFVMSFLSGRCSSVRQYITCFLLLVFYTFCFGGAVCAVLQAFGVGFDFLTGTYGGEICLGGLIAFAIFFGKGMERVVRLIWKRRTVYPFLRDCELTVGGRIFRAKGFIDSGNTLFDGATGFPVVLCSPALSSLLKTSGALAGRKGREMAFSTLSGRGKIPVYLLENLRIYTGGEVNIIYNVAIGLSAESFFGGGEYDLILNPAALGGSEEETFGRRRSDGG